MVTLHEEDGFATTRQVCLQRIRDDFLPQTPALRKQTASQGTVLTDPSVFSCRQVMETPVARESAIVSRLLLIGTRAYRGEGSGFHAAFLRSVNKTSRAAMT